MDLAKHIGSLLIIGFPGPTLEREMEICRDIAEHGLGGVILFNRCLHTPSQPANVISFKQLKELCTSLQHLADETLLTGHTTLTREQAESTAAMLAALGINCNFAPVVDLDTNPSNPVIGAIERSFSEDPAVVARHAAAWIEAHRSRGVLSCVKHFPGHGAD